VAKLSLAIAAMALAYALLVPDSEVNTQPRAGLSATASYGEALAQRSSGGWTSSSSKY
jgi:hypothetical protein